MLFYDLSILQLTSGRAISQLSDITSCIGDTITLNCTVESLAHTWDFGLLSEASITPAISQDIVTMGFTFQLVEFRSTVIVSSVSGTVIPELNNTVIVCRDGLRPVGEGDQQEATVMVFGELLSHDLEDMYNEPEESTCITLRWQLATRRTSYKLLRHNIIKQPL